MLDFETRRAINWYWGDYKLFITQRFPNGVETTWEYVPGAFNEKSLSWYRKNKNYTVTKQHIVDPGFFKITKLDKSGVKRHMIKKSVNECAEEIITYLGQVATTPDNASTSDIGWSDNDSFTVGE